MADSGEPVDSVEGLVSRHGRRVTLTEEGRQFQIDTKEKNYQRCLKELKTSGINIVRKLGTADKEESETLKDAYIRWKRTYISLAQTSSELQALFSEGDR